MKTLYMHIGLNKTGTKTIQRGLMHFQKNLADRGYYLPATGNFLPNIVEHSKLPKVLRYQKNEINIFEKLLEEIKICQEKNIIISAEGFGELDEESIRIVKDFFKDINVKVVLYLRRQDAWYQSIWIQRAKLGVTLKPFDQWVHDSKERRHAFVDYAASLKLWSEIFGKENIIVRVFEKSQLDGGIFTDFLQTCQVPNNSGIKFEAKIHTSPGVNVLGIAQYVFLKIKPTTEHAVYHKACKIIFRSLNQFAKSNNWQDTKYYAITPELHKQIMERHAEQNAWVAREFFDRDELFFDQFIPRPTNADYDISELKSTDVLALMAFVTSDLLKETFKS